MLNSPKRFARAGSLLLATTMLAACGSVAKDDFRVGSVQGTYKTRHPIALDEKERTLDLAIGADAVSLPRAQASATEGFAYGYRRAPAGTVTILVPHNSPNAGAASAIANQVAEILRREGVPPSSIVRSHYDASRHGAAAPIRVSYHAVTASVERCGKWPEDLAGANLENRNWHNFGCSAQNNMAAQIANPNDLIAPRGMTQSDAQRRNQIIDDYRQGTDTLPSAAETVFTSGS